ncbi:MAG: TIGR03067 domain-containing protein [Acidobacteriota bacterium]
MPPDLDLMQGVWKVSSLELDGMKLPSVMFLMGKVAVKGATFQASGMGSAFKGDLQLDETTRPKSFKLEFTEGSEEGNTCFGIYELDGDRWTLCLAMKGAIAPEEFATTRGSQRVLQVLQKA